MPALLTSASEATAPAKSSTQTGTGRAGDCGAIRPTHIILLIGVLDAVLLIRSGLAFTGWQLSAGIAFGLFATAFIYARIRVVPALAELTSYAALWVSFSVLGAINTYLAASLARPLQDTLLATGDAALRFDWAAWTAMVRAHPAWNLALRAAYSSLMLQIFASLALFSLLRIANRNREMLTAAAIGLLLTSAIAGAIPALGPWLHFDTGAWITEDTDYLAHVQALRSGNGASFSVPDLQGIVVFPSYHTVLAIIITVAHRGVRWTFPFFAALNALMLVSIPSEGGHYLVDMIGGVVVALVALALGRQLARWHGPFLPPPPRSSWPG